MFKKLACFTGWLLVLTLSLMFCFTFGLLQNWSTPTIFLFWLSMLLLAMLLWCSFVAIAEVIKEKKGRRWFDRLRLSRREYVLWNHWRSGVRIIRRIRRQRVRLPWYLLIGERCGKSTLLASSGLPRFYDDNDDTIVGSTRTLKWWFFRQVCVLELSSNFLSGPPAFRQVWKKLSQWCMRFPVPSGIIVTLPMRVLMTEDLSLLHTLARQQRTMIEPLVRRFGNRMPLYIMVTQSDHFPGFSLWYRQLSQAQRQQPLGYEWQTPPHIDGQDELTLQPLFDSLKEGMSHVRLSMGYQETLSAQDNSTLLDFPEAFAGIEPRLRYVLASLCEPNTYFSHPHLCSVWFSATEPQVDNRGRRSSIFIQDLLTGHLYNRSQYRNGDRWFQGTRAAITRIIVLSIFLLWITVSACVSFGRLQPEMTHLSADELATFLVGNENALATSWLYLPFWGLLEKQYRFAEIRLSREPAMPRVAESVFRDLQQMTLSADPVRQREIVLQLSYAILTWQKMRSGITLEVLNQEIPVAETLQQRNYPGPLSPYAVLALERYYMQHPEGGRWLQAAQKVLDVLVNHDPELKWLVAPAASLPALKARTFWPSLPETVTLSGIWTHDGKATLNSWIEQIEQATGHPQPLLQQFQLNEANTRQNMWQNYLIDVTAHLTTITPVTMSRDELIAVGRNHSPAMQFAIHTLNELDDIAVDKSQTWLLLLRQLQWQVDNSQASRVLRYAVRIDKQWRESLTRWLQGDFSPSSTGSSLSAELPWQNALRGAVKEAVAIETNTLRLTRGLFNPTQNADGRNPLIDLFPAFVTLREHLSPENNQADIAAVWLLYQNDANRLLGNAMSRSACWLNNQWKDMVLWPLNNTHEQDSYETQQYLAHESVGAFLRGPAKALLTSDMNGVTATEFAGMKVPLTSEFIRLAQQAFSPEILQEMPQRTSTRENDQRASIEEKIKLLQLEQKELEKKSWKINVTSLPATIPGGARVSPTGSQLTLSCQKGEQQLKSMNFADTQEFIWQPGQCYGMAITIFFPDFSTSYRLNGDDVWPWFVNDFTDGEMLLSSSNFGDHADLLEQLGIEQILVRYTVSNPQDIENSWQSWSLLDAHINELRERIVSINKKADVFPLNPISILPGTIAQCQ